MNFPPYFFTLPAFVKANNVVVVVHLRHSNVLYDLRLAVSKYEGRDGKKGVAKYYGYFIG